MKRLLALILISASLTTSLAASAFDEYEFEHMKKIDAFDFQREIRERDGFSFVVFNNGRCARINPKDCHDFEWKLDYFTPKMEQSNPLVKVFNMDTRYSDIFRRYNIKKLPAVIVFKDGGFHRAFEPDTCDVYRNPRNPDCQRRARRWKGKMLQDILDFFHKLPQNAWPY